MCASREHTSVVAQITLRTQLLTGKHNPDKETMQEHFQKFDRLVRQLKAAGGTMDEGDVMVHLLLSLPAEYNIVSTVIQTVASDNLTLTFIKTRLLDEKSKQQLLGRLKRLLRQLPFQPSRKKQATGNPGIRKVVQQEMPSIPSLDIIVEGLVITSSVENHLGVSDHLMQIQSILEVRSTASRVRNITTMEAMLLMH
jgi:hypothetical protein